MPDLAPSTPAQPHFQRALTLFDAVMLVTGSMIGSGIFIVSADIARQVGSAGWLLAVWLLTGLITICGAVSYGELAAMFPRWAGSTCTCARRLGGRWRFCTAGRCFSSSKPA